MIKIRYRGRVCVEDDFNLPLSWLNSHVVVSGIWQIGGKRFLRKLAQQINKEYPEIGLLFISHLEEGLKESYPWDACYDIRENNFQLPYFHGSNKDVRNVEEWVAAITSSLGFTNCFEEQFTQYVQEVELPEFLPALFENFRELVFESESLPPEDYYTLFCHSEDLDESWNRYNLLGSHENLKWVDQLISGKNVFIDMRNTCKQNFAFLLMLQNLRSRMPWNSSSYPRVLIFMEQGAYQLLNHRLHHGEGYNHYISNILEIFKQKAISLIVEEDQVQYLTKELRESAKLKVFFRSMFPGYQGFSLDEEEVKIIERLNDQEALIYSNE